MSCKAGQCNRTITPKVIFIVILSLDWWLTKAKGAPSKHEVRLTLLETNPVFLTLRVLQKYLQKPVATMIICEYYKY